MCGIDCHVSVSYCQVMSPQPRGVIPESSARRILKAMALRSEGQAELEAAVADALAAGASVREVAALSGLSTTTIQKYKRTQRISVTES